MGWWRPAYGWAGLAAAAAVAVWLTIPGLHSPASPMDDRIAVVQQIGGLNVGLLRNYGVVQRLDLLENFDLIEHLNKLRPVSKSSHGMQS